MIAKISIFILFALCAAYAANFAAAGAPVKLFCNTNANELGAAETAMIAGTLLMATLLALAYMIGEAMHEPRFTEWAKTEVPQLAVSAIMFVIIFLFINGLCTMSMSDFLAWSGLHVPDYIVPAADLPSLSAYNASFTYLRWGLWETETTITAIRAKMGALQIRATTNKYDTTLPPFGALGTSTSPFSGDYSVSGMHGTLLQLNTVFLLSLLLQYFSLALFSSGQGILLMLLPIGLVLRTVPFMRGFGGALVALAVSLYFVYPIMLSLLLLMLGQLSGYDLSQRQGGLDMAGAIRYENEIEGTPTKYSLPNAYPNIFRDDSPGDLYGVTAFNFLRAVLLPLAGLLVMAGLAKDISRLFGDEIDAGKLVQLV